MNRSLPLWLIMVSGLGIAGAVAAASVPGEFSPRTAVAEAGPWRPVARAFGRVVPVRESTLTAPLPLRIASVEAGVGDRVKAGEVLAGVSAPGLAARIRTVQAAGEEAALARERLEIVKQQGRESVATRDQLVRARADLQRAQSRQSEAWDALEQVLAPLGTEQSRQRLGRRLAREGVDALIEALSVVRAPFGGVITARMVAEQEVLPRDAPLFRVEDASEVYVDAGFPRRLAADELGGAAVAELGGETIPLHLEARLPRFDATVGLWTYRYRAPNTGLHLADGMWVAVRVSGAPRPVAWVPQSGVVSRGGEDYVVRAEGDSYRAVRVETGPGEAGRVPVLRGLSPGQTVVTQGAYLLLYRDLKRVMQPTD